MIIKKIEIKIDNSYYTVSLLTDKTTKEIFNAIHTAIDNLNNKDKKICKCKNCKCKNNGETIK